VTIGTPDENDAFLTALSAVVSEVAADAEGVA
jgi:histidinol-phosphate/aromatic aminotransferase/cobyric acid decarboxylase-like protein